MARPKAPFTVGSRSFDRDTFFEEHVLDKAKTLLQHNDLEAAIVTLFHLVPNDTYVYRASANVSLSQVQSAINAGAAHGLHNWYLDKDGGPIGRCPTPADIAGYVSVFEPAKSATNTLKGLVANAKKDSLRYEISTYLSDNRRLDPSIKIPKRKSSYINPFHLLWSWSCHSLEYAGPNENTVHVKQSHHVLPVLMNHFGCVCPSYEALAIISLFAKGRAVLDIGSGTGYWTLLLRRNHNCNVIAVDSGQSEYRTVWIEDTVYTDGVKFISQDRDGGKDDMLLLVYPVVAGDFTRRVIESYHGDCIIVAGTQNGNGYTGFTNRKIDDWMENTYGKLGKEGDGEFELVAKIPLPSFAGMDEALFCFRRRT